MIRLANTVMGGDWPSDLQLGRESAESCPKVKFAADRAGVLCNSRVVAGMLSKQERTHCRYRYPSPRRSGPFLVRPTPKGFCPIADLRHSDLAGKKTLVLMGQTSDSAAHKTKQNKGSIQCTNSKSFLPQRPRYRCRPVSTMIWNGASPVPRQARSSQTRPVAMSSQGPSLAALLAPCVTRSRTSAANGTSPSRAPVAQTQINRRSGSRPSGGFLFLITKTEG